VWEGKNVVATGRKMIGATNPQASEPGTIRGDYCIEVGRNVIHGSDSVENAQKEIALWFGGEMTPQTCLLLLFCFTHSTTGVACSTLQNGSCVAHLF